MWNVGAFPNDCAGLIATGDAANFSGTYTIAPVSPATAPPVITSP
jgi:hypothetical protein